MLKLRAVCAALAIIAMASCAIAQPTTATATIGVAVSLKETATRVGAEFERETGAKITFAFGSSGQILAQIRAGAPMDAFISAANQQVDAAVKEGLADEQGRRIIATNRLVLVVPAGSKLELSRFDDIARADVKRLAIGEPKTVPSGLYAAQAITALRLDDAVRAKLVYAANVRQALDYVQRGEVDAGVVYATDARQAGDAVKVVATADTSLHEPIVYPAVLLRNAAGRDVAARFLEYLAGEKARAMIRAQGFGIPEAVLADGHHE